MVARTRAAGSRRDAPAAVCALVLGAMRFRTSQVQVTDSALLPPDQALVRRLPTMSLVYVIGFVPLGPVIATVIAFATPDRSDGSTKR